MKSIVILFIIPTIVLVGIIAIIYTVKPPHQFAAGISLDEKSAPPEKTLDERIQEANERSSHIKGLYMTAEVANDNGAAARRLREKIISLADTTEINGLVIDAKEVCGPDYQEANIRKLLEELHAKKIWAIARIVTFKDASQIHAHPEWYLTRTDAKTVGNECANKRNLRAAKTSETDSGVTLWRDRRGGYWLDPASEGARNYILALAKKIIDLGFDELQFDYIRFPSDGDVEHAQYPTWDGTTPKYLVMKSFFEFLHKNLKSYKPEIILSADLFGYAAIREGDVGIGQRLDDIGDNFDYISFMVYPSHYYSGLRLPEDLQNGFAAINYSMAHARKNPGIVVMRSLQLARDFLDGKIGTTTLPNKNQKSGGANSSSSPSSLISSSSPILPVMPYSRARLRPWLEDFFHDADKSLGNPYGAEKVRLQIDGAEAVEKHGWLLWNAANVYTENALIPLLKKEQK